MILLDSCAVLEILFGESDSLLLSEFLDAEKENSNEIIFLPLTLLESSTVVAVRYKEKRIQKQTLSHYLNILQEFGQSLSVGDLASTLIMEAAQIKSEHAASMVDCYLIANAISRGAEIVTCDSEILKYWPKRAKSRKITKKFLAIHWRN